MLFKDIIKKIFTQNSVRRKLSFQNSKCVQKMGFYEKKNVSWQMQVDRVSRTSKQSKKISSRKKQQNIIPIEKVSLSSRRHQKVVLWALITQKIYEYCHTKKSNPSNLNLSNRDFCFYSSFYLGSRRKQFFMHTWLSKRKMFRRRRYSKSSSSSLERVHTFIQKVNYKIF